MAELMPNPDGCTWFEPNPFKREKCKHCGRLWTEHLGAIDDKFVLEFAAAMEKTASAKQRQDEAAKAAAKKGKNGVKPSEEDQWFLDADAAGKDNGESDEEEDTGFQMVCPASLAKQTSNGQVGHKLSVRNLIDFGECDVPGEAEGVDGVTSLPQADSAASMGSFEGFSMGDGGMVAESSVGLDGPLPTSQEGLVQEVEHLRQLLADTHEENKIELSILQEEAAERQHALEELQASRTELEVALADAREELQNLRSCSIGAVYASQGSSEVERHRIDADSAAVDEMRAQAEAAESRAEAAEVAAAAARQELEAERARLPPCAPAPAPNGAAATSTGTGNGDAAAAHAEAYAVAEQMGRQATQTLREIRQSAEQQLLWLKKLLPPPPEKGYAAG